MPASRGIIAAALAALLAGAGVGPEPGPTRHTNDALEEIRPAWSPDGRLLAFARIEDGGAAIRQYVREADPAASPRRVTERTQPEYQGVFSPDGRTLLLTVVNVSAMQGNADVAAVPVAGGEPRVVAGEPQGKLAHQEWPAWSPDGKRFAFSSTHEGNQEIYTAAADGSDVARVTQSPGHDAHPCWTPDGAWIVFATDRWGGLELARCRPDGTGLVRLTDSPGLDDYPAVSPDGSKLAFVSNRDGNYEIYLANPDGADPANLSRHPGRDTTPTWNPDGSGVTFVSDRDGTPDVYTLPARP